MAAKETFSKPFGFHHTVFRQWVFSLSYLRNLCAHHNRLWNRVFSIPPKVAKKHRSMVPAPDRFHAFAIVLVELLATMDLDKKWVKSFQELLAEYPEVDPCAMGFPANWEIIPFWRDRTLA